MISIKNWIKIQFNIYIFIFISEPNIFIIYILYKINIKNL